MTMGGSQTKDATSSPVQWQDATPPRDAGAFKSKRQLPVDPRSPTDNIARTPIIVDGTPSNVKILDPRSPTYGIERTPLTLPLLMGQESQLTQQMEAETSKAFSVDRAPLTQPEETGDAAMITPQKPPPRAVDDPLEFMDIPAIDDEDVSPLLHNAEQQPLPLDYSEPTPLQPKPSSTQPKKLFPDSNSSQQVPPPPLMAAGAGVKQVCVSRSLGLVARDANSPRSIVQSKQRRTVTKAMGGVGSRVGIDKENFAH